MLRSFGSQRFCIVCASSHGVDLVRSPACRRTSESCDLKPAVAHAQWHPIFTLQGLPADAPAETRQAWAALLPADFVEGLWHQLQGLWAHMAFCRPGAAASHAQAAAPVAAAQSPGEHTPAQAAVPVAAEHFPPMGASLQTQQQCLSVLHSPPVRAGTSGKASCPALPLLRQQC